MSFAFLTIVTVSVDYAFVQVAFQPLIGQAYTATGAALETLVVLAAAGRADHLVDQDHHPGQQRRGRDRGHRGASG